MKTNKQLLAAYRYFNPYHWDGDYCNPWRELLAEYRRKRDTRFLFNGAKNFSDWLIAEAAESAYCITHDC